MRPAILFAMLLALAVTTVASIASAHCRKTTAGGDESYDAAIRGVCAGGPNALPLYWQTSCIALNVVVDPELERQGKMTSARASEIMQRVIADWASVQCHNTAGASQPIAIRVVDGSREQCPGGGTGGTRNVVHFSASPSQGDGLLAVTDVSYDGVNGVISNAQTRLLDVYDELGATTMTELDMRVERVVRHEMGHFLGLAHSEDRNSVMYAGYDMKRKDGLTNDDAIGICDAYSPDQPIGAGCAVGGGGGAAGTETGRGARHKLAGAVAMMALIVVGRWRRKKKKPLASAALIGLLATIIFTAAHETPAAAQGLMRVSAQSRPSTRSAATDDKKEPNKPIKPRKRSGESKPTSATTPTTTTRGEDAALLQAVEVLKREEGTRPLLAHKVTSENASSSSSSSSSSSAFDGASTSASASATSPAAATTPAEPQRDEPATGVAQTPPQKRTSDLYLGARYRVFALPKPLLGIVGKSNEDLLFHSASIEADFHHERLSFIPTLSFADLSTKDMLVGAKSNDLTSSFSQVRSDMKAIAASVGFVWSTPISRVVSFELGAELGLGVAFGSLIDNWVYETPSGPLAYGGRRFAPCQTVNDGFGCRPQDHGAPTPIRVGNYKERSFIDGGKMPTILPWVSLPLVGVRARLGNDVAMRAGIGASFTGIWAGVSVDYLVAKAADRK